MYRTLPGHWSRTAVVYQVYPRSFKDSNGDGVGDLDGIIEKFDYLNDGTDASLGVNALWLNPVYRSPMKDFGYDITDYRDIDPLFGDLGTFDRLVAEAHQRGIKIIMDFVPNHTSAEHPWFLSSRSSRADPKRDWYIWRDGKGSGAPPNNWLSVFGGPAWTFDEPTGQYYMHSFLSSQPDLNWRNPDVRAAMERVLEFWLHRGVDGFRSDAVYHLFKDAEFRDDPPNPDFREGSDPYQRLLHAYSAGQSEVYEATGSLCSLLGLHGDTFMVSEVYLDIAGMQKYYRACKDGLHAPFNFNLMGLPWEARAYKRFIDQFEAALKPDDVPTYVLGNHDKPRVASRLGQQRARLLGLLLLTLRGMPFIYYGEELGLEDAQLPPDCCRDPWGKNTPGFGRDPERTPMQWDARPHAGFTEGEPWLPVSSDYREKNVAAQSKDPHSMLALYKELIHYRARSPALLTGEYQPLESGNEHVFAFRRESASEKLLIALNFSDEAQATALSVSGSVVCRTERGNGENTLKQARLKLRPHEGVIISFA